MLTEVPSPQEIVAWGFPYQPRSQRSARLFRRYQDLYGKMEELIAERFRLNGGETDRSTIQGIHKEIESTRRSLTRRCLKLWHAAGKRGKPPFLPVQPPLEHWSSANGEEDVALHPTEVEKERETLRGEQHLRRQELKEILAIAAEEEAEAAYWQETVEDLLDELGDPEPLRPLRGHPDAHLETLKSHRIRERDAHIRKALYRMSALYREPID